MNANLKNTLNMYCLKKILFNDKTPHIIDIKGISYIILVSVAYNDTDRLVNQYNTDLPNLPTIICSLLIKLYTDVFFYINTNVLSQTFSFFASCF